MGKASRWHTEGSENGALLFLKGRGSWDPDRVCGLDERQEDDREHQGDGLTALRGRGHPRCPYSLASHKRSPGRKPQWLVKQVPPQMLRGWVSSEHGAERLQVHLALTWVRGAEAPPSLFWDQAEEGGSGSSGLEQNMCSVYEAEVQGPEACWARLDGTLGSCSSLPGLLA